MKIAEKLEYIQENHFSDWLSTRRVVADEISDKQYRFCICGRLATGFHESSCGKLRTKINAETLKKLEHLLPTNK